MIRIPCQCGHLFVYGDNMAGALVQCPQCRRLNELPRLDDLPFITQDGTYEMTEAPEEPEKDRLSKLTRAFSPQKVDEAGEEIDLRSTPDEMLDAGFTEIPLAGDEPAKPPPPKYDPETGELIRPLQLRSGGEEGARVHPSAIPLATPMLSYESAQTSGFIRVARIFLEPFMPVNAVVMFLVLLAHGLWQAMAIVTLGGFFILALPSLLLAAAIVAHYGNVIDEIGPSEGDELPRPLRHVGFREDIWDPFTHMIVALALCYGMAAFTIMRVPDQGRMALIAAVSLAALGTLAFPAVLMTVATSGSTVNLRPDRVLGVIAVWRGGYLLATTLWAAAAATYGAGVFLTMLQAAVVVGIRVPVAQVYPVLMHPVLCYGLLFVGIYLMHVFCWYVGLSYRTHHRRFPWDLQSHTPRAQRMAAFYEAKRRARLAAIAAAKPKTAKPPSAAQSAPRQQRPQR